MIKIVENLEEVIDFAWLLSQDKLHASYPRRETLQALKAEMDRVISRENQKIIAYYQQDVLRGLCAYYWIPEEKYAQTILFLINHDYQCIADEFIDFLKQELSGYHILIGVPSTNKAANDYFIERNVECIEASAVTNIRKLGHHTSLNHSFIEEIDKDSFEAYAAFHDKHAIPLEMYYVSENVLKDIERVRIYVFKHEGKIRGSIFATTGKQISEIIGVFVEESYKDKGIEKMLIQEMLAKLYHQLGEIEEILYFVDENTTDQLDIALETGFKIKEKYRCYKYLL